jgi:hypothetical protein
MYCGDYNAQENQESGNEISAPDDDVGTPKRVEQFWSKVQPLRSFSVANKLVL